MNKQTMKIKGNIAPEFEGTEDKAIQVSVNLRLITCFLLAVFALFGVDVFAQEQVQSRGTQLLVPFKQELQAALRSGMDKGVLEAIAACQIQAPRISDSLSREGIRVGRTSHRLRNPDNAPPGWVKPILDAYVDGSEEPEPFLVSLPNNREGYVEPIRMKPLCTTCHGVAIASDVQNKLKTLYPDDRAVGFKVGELRGLFWVEYPTEQ